MKMKYILRITFLMITFGIGMISCVDEPAWRDNGGLNPNGVKVVMSLIMPDAKEVATNVGARSIHENNIENVFLLIFDENEKFIEYQPANQTEGTYNFIASVTPRDSKCTIYIIANAPLIMAAKKDTWVAGETSVDQIKRDLLKSRLSGSAGGITEMPPTHPLVSVQPVELDKIEKNMTITDVVLMERATAKVSVSVTTPDFILYGGNLCNVPVQGYLFPGMDGSSIAKADYWGNDGMGSYSSEYMICRAAGDNPLYCYESPAANKTYLVIKASYKGIDGYYRIDLKKDNSQLALQRNYSYIVNITKVQTPGYRTAEEAKANAPLNDMPGAGVDIEVSDSYSHDIVSNGIQYLGVSNSELIIYQSGSISDLVATVLNYTVPEAGWNEGAIIVNGEGMTLSSGGSMYLSPSNTTNREIKINLDPNSKGGTLTFQIGNLYKVVTVKRYDNMPAVMDELRFDNIAVADKSNNTDIIRNNIAFSTKSGIYPNYDDRLFSAGGDMFVKIEPNTGYGPELVQRKGSFYLTHSNDGGKIKFIYTQNYLDVYTGMVQIKPYTYVGTFHRWNETAERIIRIRAIDPDPTKTWTAIVVEGSEFIELDTNRSPDPGITLYPYGFNESNPADRDNALYTTAAQVEANCRFTANEKGKSVVRGRGDLIYFRVGMKSMLQSSSSSPRYGLIALIHSEGNHLIYVRQGEEPDYLMRDGDGMSRPKVIKISPYNLSIPVPSSGSRWPQYYDVPQNGGQFVDYPSKGGYLFQGGANYRGYRGYAVGGLTTTSRANNNLCPWGRMPADGVSDQNNNTGFVANSELRQSFWLYPANGFGRTDHGNMLRGYIADGWYDRRKMRYPNAHITTLTNGIYRNDGSRDGYSTYQGVAYNESNPTSIQYFTPTVVDEVEGEDMAFAGMLLYNPYNFASLFIPATGSINGQMGARLQGMGAESNVWTNTMAKNLDNYTYTQGYSYLSTGYYTGWGISGSSSFVLDTWVSPSAGNLDAFSIRCVKE